MWLVQHLDGSAASMDPLHDGDAVNHGPGRPVPFRKHQHVVGSQGINRPLQLRTTLYSLSRCLLREDSGAPSSPQSTKLAIQVLLEG